MASERSGNACGVCGDPLGPRQTRFCGRACAGKWRHEQAWTEVPCANPQCPRPDELVPRRRDKLAQPGRSRAYHPECMPKGGVQPKTGRDAICARCGANMGYRPASWFDAGHRHCDACGKVAKPGRRRTWQPEVRPCAHCSAPVSRTPYQARGAAEWFCSRTCHMAWRTTHRRVEPITCRGCGKESRAPNRRRFATYDADSATYECELCQHPRSPLRRCARGGCDHMVVAWPSKPRRYCSRACADKARRVVREPLRCRNPRCKGNRGGPVTLMLLPAVARRRKFCSKACAVQHRRRYREKVECRGCGARFYVPHSERDRHRYHSAECRRSHETSHPASRPQSRAAEKRVLDAWRGGVRGPRHLAAAAGCSLRVVYRLRQRDGLDLGSDAGFHALRVR